MEIFQAKGSFTPDELAVLDRVFDECCQEAIVKRSTLLTAEDEQLLRTRLAEVLILTYSNGEHDPERMKLAALKAAIST